MSFSVFDDHPGDDQPVILNGKTFARLMSVLEQLARPVIDQTFGLRYSFDDARLSLSLDPEPSNGRFVKITDTADGAGIYKGKNAIAPTDPLDPTSDLTDAQVNGSGSGAGSSEEHAIFIINPGEAGADTGTHWLDPNGFPNVFWAVLWGISDDDSGNKPVYMMVDNQFSWCGNDGSSGSGSA